MKPSFQTVQDVVRWRLCIGCGACAPFCQSKRVVLADHEKQGIRPVVGSGECGSCRSCIEVCPGLGVDRQPPGKGAIDSLRAGWGEISEVWEGYAVDEQVRQMGSSGGVATAIALYCLKKEGVGQVIHAGPDEGHGLKNRTVFSHSDADLLKRTGSRYAPASPCDGLGAAAEAGPPSVFIGKPCDIQGVRKAELARTGLGGKIGLTVSIFCAGTPSTAATLDLIESLGIPADEVTGVRYRGRGWPGTFAVWTNGSEKPVVEIPYLQAWGFLQKYRPFRCYLCPDGTGEFADISCGDPWYRKIAEGEQGYSLILLRTERGREVFHRALGEGYVSAQRVKPEVLPLSQPGFPAKRGAVWGRLSAMKMFGIPTPKYDGWPLFQCWMELSAKEKARSVLGTARRIIQRKYYKPMR